MPNVFKKAKADQADPKVKKGTKKPSQEQVRLDGLERLASVNYVIGVLEEIKAGLVSRVKNDTKEWFVRKGMEHHKRPANFRGIEGVATASCQLRKRQEKSFLSAQDVAFLREAEVTVAEVTAPERFVINPAYADNQEILAKAAKALAKVKGLPEDFIQFQPAETAYVVPEQAMDDVFQSKKARRRTRAILDVIATVVVVPKLDETDKEKVKTALNLAKRELAEPK